MLRPTPHSCNLARGHASTIQYIPIRTTPQAVSENSAADLSSIINYDTGFSGGLGSWCKADRHTARHSTEYSSTNQPEHPTESLDELTYITRHNTMHSSRRSHRLPAVVQTHKTMSFGLEVIGSVSRRGNSALWTDPTHVMPGSPESPTSYLKKIE